MKIIDNEALYQRNMRVAFIANIVGMFMLLAAVFVLFNSPGQLLRYFAFLLGGILLMQVGVFFGRWGKRADLSFNRALKSLDNKHTIYHHRSPAQHLLVGPNGIWILLPKHVQGEISYDKKKQVWKVSGGNLASRFWRRLTQEKIGRPHFEAMIEAGALDRFLQKHWTTDDPLHVQAAVVFLHEDVTVNAGDSPFPAVQIKKLKAALQNGEKKGKLTTNQVKQLQHILDS
jgi:hypothetical protein